MTLSSTKLNTSLESAPRTQARKDNAPELTALNTPSCSGLNGAGEPVELLNLYAATEPCKDQIKLILSNNKLIVHANL